MGDVGKPPAPRRRRVLIGAYACGPVEESEASAGWEFARAAAVEHDVTVITRTRFRATVEAALDSDPDLAAHLAFVFVDPARWIMRLRQRLPGALYWFYPLWQGLLRTEARRRHARHPFDVAHHVTFANDWMRCGLVGIRGLPLVWGPVGGASRVPYIRVRRWLGLRGTLTEASRDALTAIPRRIWGDRAARGAAVVVAQNPDVARRFAHARHVVVEPNAAMERGVLPARPGPSGDDRSAVFAGRLLAWKGARLALAAVAEPGMQSWRLDLYGEGYERASLEALASRLGVSTRVRFHGRVPREEVLRAFGTADALLFPSLHDQAGWVAAEASAMGCPVVCLPLGGPATLAERNAIAVPLDDDIPAGLARGLRRAAAEGGTAHDRWSSDRLPALVAEWYAHAIRTESHEH